MRLVFFGTPAWSAISLRAIAASRHEVAAVVSAPDRPVGRSKAPRRTEVATEADRLGLPVLQPATLRPAAARQSILEHSPEALVVVAYGRILPGRLLDAPRHGAINLHFSLLPRHRGASPVQHTILAGDEQAGVTTMLMDRGLDTGPLIARRAVPLEGRETADELGARLASIGAGLLVETLDALEAGTAEPRPQEEARATLAPRIEKEHGHVRWSVPADEIDRMIRAYSRWPPVVAHGPRGTLHVVAARARKGRGGGAPPPGTVVAREGDALIVTCGDGTELAIDVLKPAGGRAMPAARALPGGYVAIGARLGDGPAP